MGARAGNRATRDERGDRRQAVAKTQRLKLVVLSAFLVASSVVCAGAPQFPLRGMFGAGAAPPTPKFTATCGGTTTTVGANTICTFTSSGTFTVTAGSANVSYLLVGGGGGGALLGGGGGGELVSGPDTALSTGSYPVVVGRAAPAGAGVAAPGMARARRTTATARRPVSAVRGSGRIILPARVAAATTAASTMPARTTAGAARAGRRAAATAPMADPESSS